MSAPLWLNALILAASGVTSIVFAYVGVGYVVDLRASNKPNKVRKYLMVGWFTSSFVLSGLAAIKEDTFLMGY